MAVSEELIKAYTETSFHVLELEIVIKIGEKSPELDDILKNQGATDWAFITAHNPYSNLLPDAENLERHKRLKMILDGNYHTVNGIGIDKERKWIPEQSLLVYGIDREKACEIGRLFEQNAIVVGKLNEPAELVVLF
jgi:hypothetical protein